MQAAAVVLGLVGLGACCSWLAWKGSQRRLAPGGVLGIRLRSTLADDEAWYEAHEAAAGPLGVGGAIAILCAIGVAAVGLDPVGVLLAVVGSVAVLVSLAWATLAASRSAGAVAEGDSDPDPDPKPR